MKEIYSVLLMLPIYSRQANAEAVTVLCNGLMRAGNESGT